jgi:hypothetical protein
VPGFQWRRYWSPWEGEAADTAHGLVIAATGSAVWFLGNPTSAGMHSATITFTAATAGVYQYICAVPGHAQKGMVGTFIVTSERLGFLSASSPSRRASPSGGVQSPRPHECQHPPIGQEWEVP